MHFLYQENISSLFIFDSQFKIEKKADFGLQILFSLSKKMAVLLMVLVDFLIMELK